MIKQKEKVMKLTRYSLAFIFAYFGTLSSVKAEDFSNHENRLHITSVQQQQKYMISVVDEKGEPIIGASVVSLTDKTGSATNVDGKCSIIAKAGEQIRVSYIGYKDRVLTLGSKSNLLVSLVSDNESLDEVIVVGYGTMRKNDVTGSISVAKGTDLIKNQNFSALDNLRGKASGVTVFSNSEDLGASAPRVIIRGISTINASSDPLYVVDGVVMTNFALVNPNDIESIEVLKDASATAIYGARGANGVINGNNEARTER